MHGARLEDLLGRRREYATGLLVFVSASVLIGALRAHKTGTRMRSTPQDKIPAALGLGCAQRLVTRRPILVVAVVLLAAAVAAPALRYLWNSADENHPCEPDAGEAFEQFVPRGQLPPVSEAERDPRDPWSVAEGNCVTGQSAYSIKPDGRSSLGLIVSYERFGATLRNSGASLASHRLADRRPPDATEIDRDEGYGEEGYVVAAALDGYSIVELLIRTATCSSRSATGPTSRCPGQPERPR